MGESLKWFYEATGDWWYPPMITLAETLSEMGQSEASVEWHRRADASEDSELAQRLILDLEKQGRHFEAAEVVEAARESDLWDSMAMYIGFIDRLLELDLPEKLAEAQEQLDPSDLTSFVRLAWLLGNTGRSYESEQLYRRAAAAGSATAIRRLGD